MAGSPVAGAVALGNAGTLTRPHGDGCRGRTDGEITGMARPMTGAVELDGGPLGRGLALDGSRRREPAADGLGLLGQPRDAQGGILSVWSRAQSSFFGREGALGLGGDVRTTMFGADYAKGPLMAGLRHTDRFSDGHLGDTHEGDRGGYTIG